MSDLQTAFYIIGIVYMAVMLVLLVAILAAVLVIKSKVNHVHQMVSEKVETVKNATTKLATLFGTARHFVKR